MGGTKIPADFLFGANALFMGDNGDRHSAKAGNSAHNRFVVAKTAVPVHL